MKRPKTPPLDKETMDLMGNPPQAKILDAVFAQNRHSGGSRVLQYKGHDLVAPMCDIIDMIDALKDRSDLPDLRTVAQASVDRVWALVTAGTVTQEAFMDFAHDMVIVFSIDVIEGRETLSVN